MHCGNVVMDNHRKMQLNKKQFDTIFDARIEEYFDLMFGFDLSKLGEHIGAETYPNVNRFIEEKYGKDALKLVQHLMEDRCNI